MWRRFAIITIAACVCQAYICLTPNRYFPQIGLGDRLGESDIARLTNPDAACIEICPKGRLNHISMGRCLSPSPIGCDAKAWHMRRRHGYSVMPHGWNLWQTTQRTGHAVGTNAIFSLSQHSCADSVDLHWPRTVINSASRSGA